jgi:hypothetical protein
MWELEPCQGADAAQLCLRKYYLRQVARMESISGCLVCKSSKKQARIAFLINSAEVDFAQPNWAAAAIYKIHVSSRR